MGIVQQSIYLKHYQDTGYSHDSGVYVTVLERDFYSAKDCQFSSIPQIYFEEVFCPNNNNDNKTPET